MLLGSKGKRSISLKAEYDLPDLLDWSYHSNRNIFDALVETVGPFRIRRELLERYYHVGYRQKLLAAAGLRHTETDRQEDIDAAFTIIASYCHTLLDDEVTSYLTNRGVTADQIKRHQIGTNKGYNPLQARWGHPNAVHLHEGSFFYPPLLEIEDVKRYFEKERMLFATIPFFDSSGAVTNLCCRILDDDFTEVFKYFFSHGRTSLFNANNIDLSKPFFVFEGVFDTLTAERFDIPSVAVGCSSLSEEHRRILAQYPHAVLCLDGDIAGRNGMKAVPEMHHHALPNGYDVDEFLLETPSYAAKLRDVLRFYAPPTSR